MGTQANKDQHCLWCAYEHDCSFIVGTRSCRTHWKSKEEKEKDVPKNLNEHA